MKKILSLLVLFCAVFLVNAQDETIDFKHMVDVDEKFAVKVAAYAPYVKPIVESVLENLKASNRVDVFSKSTLQATSESRAKTKDASNMKTWVRKKLDKPVKYLVSGTINKVSILAGSRGGYKGEVSFSLKIVDKVSEQTIGQVEIFSEGTSMVNSKSSATSEAIRTTNQKQINFFKSIFKLRAPMVLIEKEKRGNAMEVLIGAGVPDGIDKKSQFIVSHMQDLGGGKTREVPIGELKVKEMQGEFTLCSVRKGGKDIFSKFNQGKNNIVVELKTKK